MATTPILTNQIGGRGENAVALQLSRPTFGRYGFEVNFLGEKAQVLDFRVALLNQGGKVFGPHFFIQAKTHTARNGQRFPVGLTADDLIPIRDGLTPTFIAGIELGPTSETVWICAVTNQLTIPSIPKTHDLAGDATRLALYTHVFQYFRRRNYAFRSALS